MISTLRKFWEHPAGPRTIHFWAPMMKWALVLAGISDLNRPADQLSTFQSAALALTGIIWTRYSTQIIPINYNLLAVNSFVGMTGIYQFYRIYQFKQQKLK